MPDWKPAESLQRLLAGNQRFVDEKLTHGSGYGRERRDETQHAQWPMAAIVACADSRVAPALFFDTGIGDLFVCRTAGNSAEPATVGSLEFAIGKLQVPLIAVVGHSGCGAMQAALQMVSEEAGTGFGDGPPSPLLMDLVSKLTPSVVMARDVSDPGRPPADIAGRVNVELACQQMIARSPGLDAAVKDGRLGIVGLWYELQSGAIDVVVPLREPS